MEELRKLIHDMQAKSAESRFVSREEMCKRLAISRETYYKVTNPEHEHYDPEFPKPVSLFTGQKYRFSTLDIDHYIAKKSWSVGKAA